MKLSSLAVDTLITACTAVISVGLAIWTLTSGSGFDSRHAMAIAVYLLVFGSLFNRMLNGVVDRGEKCTTIRVIQDGTEITRYQIPSGTPTVTIDVDVLEQ